MASIDVVFNAKNGAPNVRIFDRSAMARVASRG
jgi:hypothetical protein